MKRKELATTKAIINPDKKNRDCSKPNRYGCRDATDAKPNEAILGIPVSKLEMTVENLSYLKDKAIDRSRAKKIFKSFSNRVFN